MTSAIATVSPDDTRAPTSTNGGAPGAGARQNSPTDGDSITVPSGGAVAVAPPSAGAEGPGAAAVECGSAATGARAGGASRWAGGATFSAAEAASGAGAGTDGASPLGDGSRDT